MALLLLLLIPLLLLPRLELVDGLWLLAATCKLVSCRLVH